MERRPLGQRLLHPAEERPHVHPEPVRALHGVPHQVLELPHRDPVLSLVRIVLGPERPHEVVVHHLELLDAEHTRLLERDPIRPPRDQMLVALQVVDVDPEPNQLAPERMPLGELLDGGHRIAGLRRVDDHLLLGGDRVVEALLRLAPAREGRHFLRRQEPRQDRKVRRDPEKVRVHVVLLPDVRHVPLEDVHLRMRVEKVVHRDLVDAVQELRGGELLLEPRHLLDVGGGDDRSVHRRLGRFDRGLSASEEHQERLVGFLDAAPILLASERVMNVQESAVRRHHGPVVLVEKSPGNMLVHHVDVVLSEVYRPHVHLELPHVVDVGDPLRLGVRELHLLHPHVVLEDVVEGLSRVAGVLDHLLDDVEAPLVDGRVLVERGEYDALARNAIAIHELEEVLSRVGRARRLSGGSSGRAESGCAGTSAGTRRPGRCSRSGSRTSRA